MDNEKADELIAAVKALTAAITAKASKPVAATTTPTRDNSDSKEEHEKRDLGTSARQNIEQLIRWISNGWVPLDDPKTADAMERLAEIIIYHRNRKAS